MASDVGRGSAASQRFVEHRGRIELLPSHIDTTVNLHDVYYAQREGKLDAVWLVKARGKVQ